MSTEHRSLQQMMDFRREKLVKIREAGFEPYPYRFEVTHKAAEILTNSSQYLEQSGERVIVQAAGRIVSLRRMGKASFCHIQDESGKIQCYIRRDDVGTEDYNNLFKNLDLGDIIGVSGFVFLTRTEEISIHAEELILLSKSIRPLPNLKEKDGKVFNEFDDKELRYRSRHLDFIANPDVKNIFMIRARIISSLRNYLDNHGYIEVETPALQPLYGGASARPFKTYHNTLNQELYLRIADELYLKRLIIGGFDKVYELAKNFRNEGMDRSHNPEYTSLEFYQAYADVFDMMDMTEGMFKYAADQLGKHVFHFNGHDIDVSRPFRKVSMFDLLREAVGQDLTSAGRTELLTLCRQHHLEVNDKMNYGQLLNDLFDNLVESTLIQPTFVLDYPRAISPLAKGRRDGNPELVERFELFIGGMEFVNSFSELNDPADQRERLEAQARLRELGDEEAQTVDENFLQAMEIGMPPTGGVGLGVDRIVMLMTEQNSIKDVILFPAMRPEDGSADTESE